MFKKILFLAALSGAIIGSGALTTGALAATTPAASPSTFNLSSLDDAHRDLVLDALDEFDYDWALMKPALKKKTGKTRISVTIIDIDAKWGALGLAWQDGRIHIDDSVTDPAFFQEVVLHEIAHMVDYFHLQPAKLRGQVAEIYGAPWSEIWHDFNKGFVQVFSSYTAEDTTHLSAVEDELALRALLGGLGSIPQKTPVI